MDFNGDGADAGLDLFVILDVVSEEVRFTTGGLLDFFLEVVLVGDVNADDVDVDTFVVVEVLVVGASEFISLVVAEEAVEVAFFVLLLVLVDGDGFDGVCSFMTTKEG